MGTDPDSLLDSLLSRARAAGADQADAVFLQNVQISASQRLGRPEKLERSESSALGLRVIVNQRQASVSSTDLGPAALDDIAGRAVAMARAAPEDPHCGLAETELLAGDLADLDLDEAGEPAPEDLTGRARRVEESALAVAGITNSEGAEAQWTRSRSALAASNGFRGCYAASRHAVVVSVLAGEGAHMERDYEFRTATHADGLGDLEEIGRAAAERAVKRLGPRKVTTRDVPIVFHPRVANSLLNHLAGAINGNAIARGTSFLKEKRGRKIFPDTVSVIDDPARRRGLRSRPYDGEGLPSRPQKIVADGVLETWLLDLSSARRLGLAGTGHASRGLGSPPSPAPSNLYFEPGARSPRELLAEIDDGFYVTELMGSAISMTSGDYSRGAGGFWIEKGEPVYPVSELTIAGNLNAMFADLEVADDLAFRFGIDAPTLRTGAMTVAGR